jgi:hypothetical protein
MTNLTNLLSGYKTYIAAAGLVGLSVYQFSQDQFATAFQTFLTAMTALGLRHAVAKQTP